MGNTKKVGRPETPEYRKKILRFSKIEDCMIDMIKEMKTPKEKQLVMKILEELKNA